MDSGHWVFSSKNAYESSEINYIKNAEPQFRKLYERLSDEESKDVLEGILNYRLTRKYEYLKQIRSREETYFDQKLYGGREKNFIAGGAVIDGGSFDGDTVEKIIRFYGGAETCLDIHCYEADESNCRCILDKLPNWKCHSITVHQAALWSKQGEKLYLEGSGLSGSLNAKNAGRGSCVTTESIDSYGYKNVSFIKLDIEGAEKEAIQGAKETIKRCRPIMAICAYHLQDDLLVLPKIIDSMECGYDLYLRHYMLSAGDTVLYAVPKGLVQ